MILHGNQDLGGTPVTDAAKVDNGWCESDRVDCEGCQNRKFYWQDLVGPSHLDRDPHGELLILILGWKLILLYEISLAVCHY